MSFLSFVLKKKKNKERARARMYLQKVYLFLCLKGHHALITVKQDTKKTTLCFSVVKHRIG